MIRTTIDIPMMMIRTINVPMTMIRTIDVQMTMIRTTIDIPMMMIRTIDVPMTMIRTTIPTTPEDRWKTTTMSKRTNQRPSEASWGPMERQVVMSTTEVATEGDSNRD